LDDSLPARIKLCDFGFAKGWNSDDSLNMQTLIGFAPTKALPLHTSAASVPSWL
jgi:hypothetical protein